jgi:soluble lytic murein transglycosylase
MKYFFSILSLAIVAILLAFTINCFNGYFYPIKYKEIIIESGNEFSVDSALIASIANAESGYRTNALSQKGAVGIMQILPSTAEWIADKLNEDFEIEKLSEPQCNIRYGSYYLSYLFDMFNDRDLVICAYNAGQNNVKSWLANKEYSQDKIKLDKIPFPETEKYLNKVLKNMRHYEKRYK